MTLKIPPPPSLPKEFQQLNRWLLEIQSILNAAGLINQDSVDGLPAVAAQVVTNTGDIATNTGDIATNTAAIAANTADIATNTADIATNTADIAANTAAIAANTVSIAANSAAITALQARNQIRNGNGVPGGGLGSNGDLYINNTGAPGTYLYGKIGGAWIAFA